MKKLLLVLCLLFTSLATFANQVDDIKTDSDVIKLIQPSYEGFNYKGAPKLVINSSEELVRKYSCDSLVNTWHIKNWEKADFNGDHKTDLLAMVNWYYNDRIYVVLDKGNNTFQLIVVGGSDYGKYELANVIKYHRQSMLVLHRSNANVFKRKIFVKTSRTDTLVYKYGNFVELNNEPSHYKIDSISLGVQWGWFGRENTPPQDPHLDRTIVIDHSGNAVLTNNKDFVFYILKKGEVKPRNPETTSGTFTTKISQANLQEIYKLIDYLSVKKLNERYYIPVTDLESNFLRIKFADGSTKYIADYGGVGTFGLRNLFSKFYALIANQNWQ